MDEMNEPTPQAPDRLDLLLNQWMQDCIHGSPVAQDTPSFNHLSTAALPELKRRLQEQPA